MADAASIPESGPPATTIETVSVTNADRDTASAQVTTDREPHHTATVQFDGAAKRLPAATRRELVDAVMDHAGVSASDDMDAVVPRSDVDTILRLQQRTTGFRARAAGVSSMIHADIPPNDEPVTPPRP